MTVIADKVLVVFLDAALGATDASAPKAFDEVAARGSSGFLVLPGNGQGEDLTDLEHLLNVERDTSGVRFKFPKMPVAFFSASSASCALARSLGFGHVHDTSASADALATAKDLLTGNAKQFVFVHASAAADAWVHALVHDVLEQQERDTDSRSLVALVQTARHAHAPSSDDASIFRPRQSFEKVHGEYPAPSAATTTHRRLLYAFYQKDRTRNDRVAAFDEAQIDAHGCYGAMSALMLLKEMAFRLGFAPKYGA